MVFPASGEVVFPTGGQVVLPACGQVDLPTDGQAGGGHGPEVVADGPAGDEHQVGVAVVQIGRGDGGPDTTVYDAGSSVRAPLSGTDRGHAVASPSAAGGQAVELCCKKATRIRPMLAICRSRAESRVTTPVILFAPVSSSRTAPALFSRCSFGQWNVCDALRVFPCCSTVWCESRRLAGLPAVCLIRALVVPAGMLLKRLLLAAAPVDSAGVMLGPTRWALPDDLHGGEAMSGSQIPASVCPEGRDWCGS